MGRKRIYDKNDYKFSIILEHEIKEKLEEIALEYDKKIGPLINLLIKSFLFVSPRVSESIIKLCSNQINQINQMIAVSDCFEKERLLNEKQQYLEIAKILNKGKGIFVDEKEQYLMKEIKIKDGVLIIPNDWILVNPEESTQYRYAAVIECRNSSKYGIPHFIKFCNYRYAKDYPDEFIDEFLSECQIAWPDFNDKVRKKQVKPIPNIDGKGYINIEKYLAAPTIGFFHILESDDDYFKRNEDSPYGSKIVRL
ncbi:MAG: hypothetical protein ILA13_00425 [Eubacterium sp.]|nr:hypothetical protein [Eubacterium sp.]